MAPLPKIGLIVTGGTVDSAGKDRLDLAWYIEANKRMGPGELLGQLPELGSIASVEEIPFRRLPSPTLAVDEVEAMRLRVAALRGASAVVALPARVVGGRRLVAAAAAALALFAGGNLPRQAPPTNASPLTSSLASAPAAQKDIERAARPKRAARVREGFGRFIKILLVLPPGVGARL